MQLRAERKEEEMEALRKQKGVVTKVGDPVYMHSSVFLC